MVNIEKEDKESPIEILQRFQKGKNKSIYIAIAVIILLTIIAMVGVYYEYW
ncbi:hypothetical protein NE848_12270 [Gramella jeungdoensis]|uniref:Uncharacterized protein n=1 Tax=Gramella jeungdoensis TaxID=708091 RepID=A0ABT0Z3Q4_9FLAO|nr:hypothetical protein [Gramella jeungdoensis]MCM8570159.1 hypothetical protein [Gramella jeungdoensis]